MAEMHNKECVASILAILPGTNCAGRGGCGFSSCEECAAAIAAGSPVNCCPACGDEAIEKISELTGRDILPAKHQKAFIKCGCNGSGHGRHERFDNCEAAVKAGFADDECKYGCVGCGDCAKTCTFNAIVVDNGVVKINAELCNGCGACYNSCVQNLIIAVPDDATNFVPCANKDEEEKAYSSCPWSCVGCEDCAKACPEGAISIVDNCAVIDYSKCVGCIACTMACRKKIIIDTYHDLSKNKDNVAFVRCKGGKKLKEAYTAAGAVSCAEAAKLGGLEGFCKYGCAGFGDCVKVCRYDAIEIVDGTALINPDKCVGCGDCMSACPFELPVIVDYKGSKMVPCASQDNLIVRQVVCGQGCIGCGDCADNCPNGLIRIVDGRAVIDSKNCENCGICTYVCPQNLISVQNVPEYNYLQVKALKKGGENDA